MGYFDGLTEAFFKTHATGQRIYYPFGIFGRGRILSNEDEEKKIRTMVKRTTIAVFFIGFIAIRSDASLEVKAAAILAILATQYAVRYLPVRSHPITGERMKLAEYYRSSARGFGGGTLWVLFVLSVLMTSVSVFAVFDGEGSISEKLTLLGGAAFFGVCTLVLAWMARQAGRRD